mmetsp:Transcript_18002/g.29201  ORF Transcript_18002/g.29201 Transcript_18002/m.29201 type:complete len:373 (-) Transcript_18002:491-1609(-)
MFAATTPPESSRLPSSAGHGDGMRSRPRGPKLRKDSGQGESTFNWVVPAVLLGSLVVFAISCEYFLPQQASKSHWRRKKKKKRKKKTKQDVRRHEEKSMDTYCRSAVEELNESATIKELIRFTGKQPNAGIVEKAQLLELAKTVKRVKHITLDVIDSPELADLILAYLDRDSILNLAQVCKSFYTMGLSDSFWKDEVIRMLWVRFTPRLTLDSSDRLLCALKQSYRNGFFGSLDFPHKSGFYKKSRDLNWKHFLVMCKYVESTQRGGYGNAVVILKNDLCPHHILKFVHMLSINKHASCTLGIIGKFLKLYRTLGGQLRLRSNVGFCFPIYAGCERQGTESVSHQDFMDISRASNLQVSDLVEFYSSQDILP